MKRFVRIKNTLFFILVGLVFAVTAVIGLIYRQTYTDISSEENGLDQMLAAEIPGGICEAACDNLRKKLPDVPVILRVTIVGELENYYHVSQQKAVVKEVYAGDALTIGEEVYLASSNWFVIAEGRNRPLELQRGFVNELSVDTDYLVFLSDQNVRQYQNIPVYFTAEELLESPIVPVFCYENKENLIAPTDGFSTYVPYALVRDNEFFAASEDGLEAWLSLKADMLAGYP